MAPSQVHTDCLCVQIKAMKDASKELKKGMKEVNIDEVEVTVISSPVANVAQAFILHRG